MSTGESDASGNISQRRYFRGCKCTSLLVPLVFCHERSFEERSFPSEIKNVVKILNDVGGWDHPYSLALSPTSHFLAWPLLEQRWLEFRRGKLGKKNGYRAPRGTVHENTRNNKFSPIVSFARFYIRATSFQLRPFIDVFCVWKVVARIRGFEQFSRVHGEVWKRCQGYFWDSIARRNAFDTRVSQIPANSIATDQNWSNETWVFEFNLG